MNLYDRIELFCIVMLFCVIAFAVLGGCAAQTPQQEFEAQERRVLIQEQYARDVVRCSARGGAMQVRQYHASRITRELTTAEMLFAACIDAREVIQ